MEFQMCKKNKHKKESTEYSIIIPVYNSEDSLLELFYRIDKVFERLKRSFEVIFINDCSRDKSLDKLKQIHLGHSNVIVLDLFTNFGQQNALMCGFQYCKGKYIITMDDDLQTPPEEIPKLIEKIQEGYDAVIGTYTDKHDKFYRNWGSTLFRKLNHKIFKIENNIKFSSFRIIKRVIIDEIKKNKTSYPYVSGLLVQVTRNITNIVLKHEKRKYGRSNYTIRKLVQISLNLLVNHSTIPLNIFSYIGLIVSILSLFLGTVYILNQLFSGQAPPGWTSLVVLISFYNALILIIFFVLGIYISRLLKESSDQKQYSVRKVFK